MWSQGTHRVLKSQEIRMSVIYLHYHHITCTLGHHHNGFMATGAHYGDDRNKVCNIQECTFKMIKEILSITFKLLEIYILLDAYFKW